MAMKSESARANVHYLPVGLTTFQRDLVEILVSLHAESFAKERAGTGESAAGAAPGSLSARQLTYLFNTHIRAVANHPCLLVDHYMPRQFLRMEPTERLTDSSDKFQTLHQLLNTVAQLRRPQSGFSGDSREAASPVFLKVAIVAHSIKELDLLESITLGKGFKVKRLSGTSLYPERNDFQGDMRGVAAAAAAALSRDRASNNSDSSKGDTRASSRDSTPSSGNSGTNGNGSTGSSGSGSGGGGSGPGPTGNSYTGYPKDDYDYSQKHNRKRHRPDDRNWLFLTTSTHLAHEPSRLDAYSIDLILSFDPLLDPALPAIDSINSSHYQYDASAAEGSRSKAAQQRLARAHSKYRVPIVKLLVRDTPDHFLLQRGLSCEGDAAKEYANIVAALDHFLRCRKHSAAETKHPDAYYSGFLKQLLANAEMAGSLAGEQHQETTTDQDTAAVGLEIPLSDAPDSPGYMAPQFANSVYPATPLAVCTDPLTVKSYQTELMQRTLRRLDAINERIGANSSTLETNRSSETERQNLLDSLKAEIGTTFKQQQELDKTKLDREKRAERTTGEAAKLADKLKQLQEKLRELEETPRTLEALYNLQEENATRRTSLALLQSGNADRTAENDECRTRYQRDSSRAAAQASELADLKTAVAALRSERDNPTGPSLNLRAHELMETRLQGELDLARRRNEFLRAYIQQRTREYKLKKKTGGSRRESPDTAGGSSSGASSSAGTPVSTTPAGSEDGTRHRSTRSAAPSYT
ncbi:Hda2 protein [Maudiozyma humilis]|uniref:Hda2 protein n=1 Tax=Maudiozyma humilis TaxID=51915 RepID=A0AAV5S6D1_MAUHU|nr:Hda2 protein [Kazachstania humilis]